MSDRSYSLRFKAIGHQWYWRYEYRYEAFIDEGLIEGVPSFKEENVMFDSYIKSMEDVISDERGGYRLLEVDNRIVCPLGVNVRVLVGSEDVIHC